MVYIHDMIVTVKVLLRLLVYESLFYWVKLCVLMRNLDFAFYAFSEDVCIQCIVVTSELNVRT